MKNSRGFTLLEILIALTLIGFAVSLMVSNFNFQGRTAENTATQISAALTDMQISFDNFVQNKATFPDTTVNGLADPAFVPKYLFVPKLPPGIDKNFGINGLKLLYQDAPAVSPDKGYHICFSAAVTGATDNTFLAIKKVSETMSTGKFYYDTTGCGAVADVEPAGSATVYATYWLTRE